MGKDYTSCKDIGGGQGLHHWASSSPKFVMPDKYWDLSGFIMHPELSILCNCTQGE